MPLTNIKNQIITTIGPTSCSKEVLNGLVDAGATSFRINLSHSNSESLEKYYSLISSQGLLPSLDTQGPQMRVFESARKSFYQKGDTLLLSSLMNDSKEEIDIRYNHSQLINKISVGDRLKIGFDGLIVSVVDISHEAQIFRATALNNGKVNPNCAIDLQDTQLILDSLTPFDVESIQQYLNKGIEAIYLSFTNSVSDIQALNQLISDCQSKLRRPKIIAKIESRKGIANLDGILPLVDGILVDRGDLSREISISRIPLATIAIINKCNKYDCPCYVATNVLDSMIESPLPSRAEISDLFNLYLQGVSGIVLAAEVAIGKYPVDCVHVVSHMHRLFVVNESSFLSFLPDSTFLGDLPDRLKYWL